MADQALEKERYFSATVALLEVMARLRDRREGCPWDVAQTFSTIAPYTIEEAYEVADAIERKSMPALKEELGDLLFQVVFHARIAEEQSAFDFADVAEALAAKMIARHPHVFGDASMRSAEAQTKAWEDMKAAERAAKGGGVLADVPMALPALMRAEKLTKRAARIGFDWPDADSVLEKLDEELAELAHARASGDAGDIRDEFGDILFVIANLGRKLGVDPEDALRHANAKFTRRFQGVERRLHDTGGLEGRTLEEMEAFWRAEKEAERTKG